MPLTKETLAIPFSTGIDQKTDPKQVLPTTLTALVNAVYTKDKMLTKRDGFRDLSQLPADANITTLETFAGNLTALGSRVLAYNDTSQTWVDRGRFQPALIKAAALARSSYNQSNVDAAVSPEGWACSAWAQGSTAFFQITDVTTTQVLAGPFELEATAKSMRTYVIGNYFVVLYMATVATLPTLRFIAIPRTSLVPDAPVSFSTTVSSINNAYDAAVVADFLHIAWHGINGDLYWSRTDAQLNTYLVRTATLSQDPSLISVTGALSQGLVWFTWYSATDDGIRGMSINQLNGTQVLAPTLLYTSSDDVSQLTSYSIGDSVTTLAQKVNTYSYSSERTDIIERGALTEAGVGSGPVEVVRSVGLASKAFLYQNTAYFLAAFQSPLQPTYFVVDVDGNVVGKIAYSNGGGYISGVVLPNVSEQGGVFYAPYLFKTLLAFSGTDNTYSQTGINLASISLAPSALSTAEIAGNLHIAGGFLWAYDGTQCVEHNFHLFPEELSAAQATASGSVANGTYRHVAVYEWTDAQGRLHRSAPSIPIQTVVSGGNNQINLNIPTLRLTYKALVRIVLYRWSQAQQVYYQVTSISSPTLNNKAGDSVAYSDTASDASILGGVVLYTTGGVLENIAFPACKSVCLWQNRLMVLSSEDEDVVWYSQEVLQATPVEPSDLLTLYIAPSTGVQGSTGPCEVVAAMDDKFLIAKANAWYYITGQGPDVRGQGGQFSDPVFITAVAGTTNEKSLALIPNGLVFESNKGIWLLGRNLSTSYIGADIQDFNQHSVAGTAVPPKSTRVVICYSNGLAAVYDYYYDRWGTFDQMPTVSSTIFEGQHTYVSTTGRVRQQTPGFYQDGGQPVLLSLSTAWLNLAGVQALERTYWFNFLGEYISPHKLAVSISYDYEPSSSQSILITPDNYRSYYGIDPTIYGQGGTYGGSNTLERGQVFFSKQKAQAVKITLQELYDASQGGVPGAGLTLSGLNFVVRRKKGYPTLPARRHYG